MILGWLWVRDGLSRAGSKQKPSRQFFKGVHHWDKQAAETRNILPNLAVPEAWKAKGRKVQEEEPLLHTQPLILRVWKIRMVSGVG